MPKFCTLAFLPFFVFATFLLSPPALGQLSSAQIDSIVEQTRKTFDVPGISVAVLKDGKMVHAKGYGLRSLSTKLPMEASTLVGIASNSKAFTAAALAMMVDEGKLKWDDKVIQYLPDFQLKDPFATQELTIRDLLTHRSGLGLGAGDLMMFPDSNLFTKKEIIHNMRFLKPESSLRNSFHYNNLMYIVAGEVLQVVSGLSWEDFIEQRIMKPIGMTSSKASIKRLTDRKNCISAHAPVEGKVKAIPIDWSETANAAGGIVSNLPDMCKWMQVWLNKGKYGDSLKNTLFSTAQWQEMWTAQMPMKVQTTPPYNIHFYAYGLGWFLNDVKGYLQASHTGGLAGVVTQVTLMPELNLGIVVLTNQQSGAAFTAITQSIKDGYLGLPKSDWVGRMDQNRKRREKEAEDSLKKVEEGLKKAGTNAGATHFKAIAGIYEDEWFGEVEIAMHKGKPWIRSRKSLRMQGPLFFLGENKWVVRWADRSLDADALLTFNAGPDNGMQMSLKAISPLTDFSFDFQNLSFRKKL